MRTTLRRVARTAGVAVASAALLAGAHTVGPAAAATTGSLAVVGNSSSIFLSGDRVRIAPAGTVLVDIPAGVAVDAAALVGVDAGGALTFNDAVPLTFVAAPAGVGQRASVVLPAGFAGAVDGSLSLSVATRGWSRWGVYDDVEVPLTPAAGAPTTAVSTVRGIAEGDFAAPPVVPGSPLTLSLPAGDATLAQLGGLSLTGATVAFGPPASDVPGLVLGDRELGTRVAADGRSLTITVPSSYPVQNYPATEDAPQIVVQLPGTGAISAVDLTSSPDFARADGDLVGLGRANPDGTQTFWLPASLAPGGGLSSLTYGRGKDTPLMGDWDGDGVTTPATYDAKTSMFYLADSVKTGSSYQAVKFGNPGDLPFVGRFQPNSPVDYVGVYRPSNRTFYFSNPRGYSSATFGQKGDLPLAGNWDGAANGVSKMGVYRPSTRTFYVAGSNTNGGGAYRSVVFGNAGDKPLAGDWDGNGIDDIGIYRPSRVQFVFASTFGPGGGARSELFLGRSTDVPFSNAP